MLRRLVTLTLVVLVGVAAGARAQESASSSIVGVVTDSTQAPLPGATVTVTQAGTGLQRVVVTDSEGRFSMPGLRPATYDIKVELSGFNNTELKARSAADGRNPQADAEPLGRHGPGVADGDGLSAAVADVERGGWRRHQ